MAAPRKEGKAAVQTRQQLLRGERSRWGGDGPHQMNKRKKTNREREIRAIETGWLLTLLLGIHSPSLCCQLAPGPSPSPARSHPVTPACSGASSSNAVAGCRGGKLLSSEAGDIWWGFFLPPFPDLALAPGALELAGIYLKFPSKASLHLLEEGFLSASVFVWLLLQRCW